MKTMKYLLSIMAAGALLTACDKETWTPGPADRDDSYIVYFPEQPNTGSVNVDPEETDITFTYAVMREISSDAITVPVEITGTGAAYCTVSPIEFADGQDETFFSVTLSQETELQVAYNIVISITDPRYTTLYSEMAGGTSAMSVSIMRGKINPLEGDWTIEDIYEGIEKEDLFKTWYMWGVYFYDEYGIESRQPLAEVTFSENDEDGPDEDYINVTGLALGYVDDDTVQWEYYNGVIYYIAPMEALGVFNGYYIGLPVGAFSGIYENGGSGGAYGLLDYMLVAGLVDEGYMALVFSEEYNIAAGNPTPNALIIGAYSDNGLASYLGSLDAYHSVVFEDPAVSELEAKAPVHKSGLTRNKLNTIAREVKTPANFVEKRGRERAHAIIDEMMARK